ncbi:hypothetical protein [Haladaptatus halobius]|uniref:hypothetical protein n=1 Tax=Haladaptatus halobius TaxID=2884875 RepID=UPI001D0B658B|nr:hypothetical protein [Haladaptatus halobius]
MDNTSTLRQNAYIYRQNMATMVRNSNIAGLGLVGLLLIAGIILFVFPEPATSGIGVMLIIAAVIVWAVQRFL